MAGLISKLLGNLSPDDVLYLSKRALDGDSGALKALKNAEGLDEAAVLRRAANRVNKADATSYTPAPNPVRAYHASPYKFDEFSTDKIGTGEGAQMYGHGLYFAEEPDVARAYRDMVPQDTVKQINAELDGVYGDLKQYETGQYGVYNDPKGYALKEQYDALLDKRQTLVDEARSPTMRVNGQDITELYSKLTSGRASSSDYAKADILEQIMIDGDALGVIQRQADDPMYTDEAYAWFEKEVLPNIDRSGTLFEVDLSINKDKMLDWAKPVNEQPEVMKGLLDMVTLDSGWSDYYLKLPDDVKPIADDLLTGKIKLDGGAAEFNAFMKLQKAAPNLDHNTILDIRNELNFKPELTGEQFYNSWARGSDDIRLGSSYDSPAAAQKLKSTGVEGIKYLDQNSRQAGDGTSNFVVFDDKNVNVINKYLRPETVAATGLLANIQSTPESQASDLASYNQGVTLDRYMSQLGADKKPDIYNYGKTFPIKRNKVTGDYSYATTGILEEVLRGLLDIGESRKSGVITNPQSILDVLM